MDNGKVMEFTAAGRFLQERRVPFRFSFIQYALLPLGDGFVGFNLEEAPGQRRLRFNAHRYAADWTDRGVLYAGPSPPIPPPPPGSGPRRTPWPVAPHYLDLDVWKGLVYVADTRRGFFIAVFDREGRPVREIRLQRTASPVSPDFRRRYMEYRRSSPRWEQEKKWLDFRFPQVFPAFFAFRVRDDRIYAVTYARENQRQEVVVLDLAGRMLRRSFAYPREPFERLSDTGTVAREFDIRDHALFALTENADSEDWELRIVPLN